MTIEKEYLKGFETSFRPSLIYSMDYTYDFDHYLTEDEEISEAVHIEIEKRFCKSARAAVRNEIKPSNLYLGFDNGALSLKHEPFHHLYPAAVHLAKFYGLHIHKGPIKSESQISRYRLETLEIIKECIKDFYKGEFLEKCEPYFKYLKDKGIVKKKEPHLMVELVSGVDFKREFIAKQLITVKLPNEYNHSKISKISKELSEKILYIKHPETGKYVDLKIVITGMCFAPAVYGLKKEDELKVFDEAVIIGKCSANIFELYDLPRYKFELNDKRLSDNSVVHEFMDEGEKETTVNKQEYLGITCLSSVLNIILFCCFLIYGGIIFKFIGIFSLFPTLISLYLSYITLE